MYCPKCGTKNDDNALYCAHCGTKLQDLEIEEDDFYETDNLYSEDTKIRIGREGGRHTKAEPQKKQEKQTQSGTFSNIRARSELISILVAAAAVIVCVIMFNVQYGAGQVASKYAQAVVGRDWNTVYDTLNHPNSGDFMTRQAFVTAETINTYGSADPGKVTGVSRGTDDTSGRTYYATYTTADGEEETMTVYLVRSGLLWKVKADEYLSESYKISVPSGATVKVDKIEVSGKYKSSSGTNQDVYEISPIYGTTHYVELSGDGFEDTAQLVTAEPSKLAEVSIILGEETITAVAKQAEEDLTAIMEAAARDQKVSGVNVINNMSSDDKDDAVYEYEHVRDDFFGYGDDNKELVSCTFSDMEAYVYIPEDSSGSDFLQVEIKANYQLDYNRVNTWFRNGSDTEEGDCTFEFYYRKNGTSWLLYTINLNL